MEELESRLAAINHRPMLRLPIGGPQPGEKVAVRAESLAKKGEMEKAKRDEERDQLERMSCLFRTKPQQVWSRKGVLSLGEKNFLIDGCD